MCVVSVWLLTGFRIYSQLVKRWNKHAASTVAECDWLGYQSVKTIPLFDLHGTMILKMSTQTQIRIKITHRELNFWEKNVLIMCFSDVSFLIFGCLVNLSSKVHLLVILSFQATPHSVCSAGWGAITWTKCELFITWMLLIIINWTFDGFSSPFVDFLPCSLITNSALLDQHCDLRGSTCFFISCFFLLTKNPSHTSKYTSLFDCWCLLISVDVY